MSLAGCKFQTSTHLFLCSPGERETHDISLFQLYPGSPGWRLCPSYQARKDRREATETCLSQTRISQHPQTKHIINKINRRERGILKVGWLSSIPLAVRGTSAVSPRVCVCVCVCVPPLLCACVYLPACTWYLLFKAGGAGMQ